MRHSAGGDGSMVPSTNHSCVSANNVHNMISMLTFEPEGRATKTGMEGRQPGNRKALRTQKSISYRQVTDCLSREPRRVGMKNCKLSMRVRIHWTGQTFDPIL